MENFSKTGTYICRKCGGEFSYSEPCFHDEEIRQENLAKFEEQNKEDTPEIIEQRIWSIAKRLQYVRHIK